MNFIPPRLQEIAEQIRADKIPQQETVRTFLAWFGAQRRGYAIVREIRRVLKKLKIKTEPDFESAYIDSFINFVPITYEAQVIETSSIPSSEAFGTPTIDIVSRIEETVDPELSDIVVGAVADPTYRIGRLASANQTLISVKPDTDLKEAITLMLSNDYSQLPVMQSDRDVKGMISWNSIGSRLALGNSCHKVKDCMEPHQEISAEISLFAAISLIVQNQYILIRDREKRISGIVTTTDLSLQFRQLGEPFLLIGEVENHVRRLIDGKFTRKEIMSARDPGDTDRKVEIVSDLTFGEYIRLLESPDGWSKTGLPIDRKTFINQLNKIRLIRNDIMHFDPDGLPDTDLEILRKFVRFLQSLRELGAVA